jgi:hypothetical protein
MRARKLPVGHDRNDLRQLAMGLLWLEKKNLQATVQDRISAVLAMTELRRGTSERRSSIPRQLPWSPMLVLPRRVEHVLDVPVQCPHDTDARKHRRPANVATRITYSASHPSASAAARNVRQASISPASDALAWLRACLAICQCGLFRSESLMYIMKE